MLEVHNGHFYVRIKTAPCLTCTEHVRRESASQHSLRERNDDRVPFGAEGKEGDAEVNSTGGMSPTTHSRAHPTTLSVRTGCVHLDLTRVGSR